LISLYLSGSKSELEEGTYTYTGDEDNRTPLEVWSASYFTSINPGVPNESERIILKNLKFSKNGNVYTFESEGQIDEIGKISIYYSGAIRTVVSE
jgi:hypothetical protein